MLISRDGENIGSENELGDLNGYCILPLENYFPLVVKDPRYPADEKEKMAIIFRRLVATGKVRLST